MPGIAQAQPVQPTVPNQYLVICVNALPDSREYLDCVDQANEHVGGSIADANRPGKMTMARLLTDTVANHPGEPIQFGNGNLRTVLQVQDRETAQRVASFLKGSYKHPGFTTIVLEALFVKYNVN